MLKTAPSASGAVAAAPSVDRSEERRRWWINAWRPSTREDSYAIKRVDGEIPREICGTLYRNGPSQKILPDEGHEALHLFDGDGLVHAFRCEDGNAYYTGRFAENPTYVAEQKAGRFCMSTVGVAAADKLTEFPFRQQHNTNVVHHGGKLMALVENAFPFEMDERTLDPIGYNMFDGKMLGVSVTAHPKIDGRTGQMVIHGYQPVEPYLQWYTVEPDGSCSIAEIVDCPYPAMMHDFAITENYVIFVLCPIVMDGEMLLAGDKPLADALTWEPERGMKLGVKRREPGAPVRWLDVPTPGYVFHPGNAYEDGDRIVVDTCTYLNPPALLESLKTWRSGRVQPGFYGVPFLYEIDLAAGKVSERQLDDRACEFPRLDDRLVGYRNRYGYAARSRSGTKAEGDPWSTLVRYDRTGGPTTVHDFGVGQWPSEPVFVPRSADAAEDDGFVMCTVYDAPNDSSYLAVLDAQNMDAEPLAKAHLEHRIPMGFHGNFAPGVV